MHWVIYLAVHLCSIDALSTANLSGERRQQSTVKALLLLTPRYLSSFDDLRLLSALLHQAYMLFASCAVFLFLIPLGICKLPSTFLHYRLTICISSLNRFSILRVNLQTSRDILSRVAISTCCCPLHHNSSESSVSVLYAV